jgi:hypothetical protein
MATIEGKCKCVRLYLEEDLKREGKLLYQAIVERLLKEGFAGATVFRGIMGFGSAAHLHSIRFVEVMEKLPVVVEVVENTERAKKALRVIEEMLPQHCLVTIQDIHVAHYYSPDGKHKPYTQGWD